MVRIYILEDQELYLEGLVLLLKKNKQFQVSGYASSATQFLSELPTIAADVFLLDVHLPELEADVILSEIRKIKPQQKVIYLTMMRGSRMLHKLEKLSFQGYILKNASIQELTNAIEIVAKGGLYFSPELTPGTNDLPAFRDTITVNKPEQILTEREKEILKLVCEEYSNAQIAEKLFISVGTVDTHRKNIIGKLGVNNTVGLVKFALTHNLL